MLRVVSVFRFQDLLLSLLFAFVGSTTVDVDSLRLNVASQYFLDFSKDVFQTGCTAAKL